MKKIEEIFEEVYSYENYPEDFDFSGVNSPELQPFDKIIILTKSEVDFLKEEGLWDENNPNNLENNSKNFSTGVVLPQPDSEERGFDDFESVICVRTICPKEGVFFDYSSFADIVTYDDFYKIVKL